jgi:hypothetical protein
MHGKEIGNPDGKKSLGKQEYVEEYFYNEVSCATKPKVTHVYIPVPGNL